MNNSNNNRRWYTRNNCDFVVDVLAPFSLSGKAINYSDGGLLVLVFAENQKIMLSPGDSMDMIIEMNDPRRLTRLQKVHGEIKRMNFDEAEKKWYIAVEVIGPWDDYEE